MEHLSKPLPFTHWFLAILLASLFLVAASAKYLIESQRWGIGGDRIEQTALLNNFGTGFPRTRE